MTKKPMPPSPRTSPKVKHIGGKGLHSPKSLSPKQVQSLAASVESHIEPRRPSGNGKGRR